MFLIFFKWFSFSVPIQGIFGFYGEFSIDSYTLESNLVQIEVLNVNKKFFFHVISNAQFSTVPLPPRSNDLQRTTYLLLFVYLISSNHIIKNYNCVNLTSSNWEKNNCAKKWQAIKLAIRLENYLKCLPSELKIFTSGRLGHSF